MDAELRRITALIQARKLAEAEAALDAYLDDHTASAPGYYLMSFAADERQERLAAIRTAARLAPDDARIRARLDKLEGGEPARGRGRAVVPLMLLLLLVLAALILGLLVTFREQLPAWLSGFVGGTPVTLPTSAEVPTLMRLTADPTDAAIWTQGAESIRQTEIFVAETRDTQFTLVAATEQAASARATQMIDSANATATALLTDAAATAAQAVTSPTRTAAASITPLAVLSPTPSLTPLVPGPTATPPTPLA